MPGAEHESRHHSGFLCDFPAFSPAFCPQYRGLDWEMAEFSLRSPDHLHLYTGELYLPSWGCCTPAAGGSPPVAHPHLCVCLLQGCFDQILEEIKTHAGVVGGVAAGIAALEVSA